MLCDNGAVFIKRIAGELDFKKSLPKKYHLFPFEDVFLFYNSGGAAAPEDFSEFHKLYFYETYSDIELVKYLTGNSFVKNVVADILSNSTRGDIVEYYKENMLYLPDVIDKNGSPLGPVETCIINQDGGVDFFSSQLELLFDRLELYKYITIPRDVMGYAGIELKMVFNKSESKPGYELRSFSGESVFSDVVYRVRNPPSVMDKFKGLTKDAFMSVVPYANLSLEATRFQGELGEIFDQLVNGDYMSRNARRAKDMEEFADLSNDLLKRSPEKLASFPVVVLYELAVANLNKDIELAVPDEDRKMLEKLAGDYSRLLLDNGLKKCPLLARYMAMDAYKKGGLEEINSRINGLLGNFLDY